MLLDGVLVLVKNVYIIVHLVLPKNAEMLLLWLMWLKIR